MGAEWQNSPGTLTFFHASGGKREEAWEEEKRPKNLQLKSLIEFPWNPEIIENEVTCFSGMHQIYFIKLVVKQFMP